MTGGVTGGVTQTGGILLTGGSSIRMGFDKARLHVDGVANAGRLALVLSQVASPVVEVGPGYSGLPAVSEQPPGSGPLAAVWAGAEALAPGGRRPPALVVACDMPFLSVAALEAIAGYPGEASVVPLVAGQLQPLCARWSPADLELAGRLVAQGHRSMKSLLERAIFCPVGPGYWPPGVTEQAFVDVDTPAEVEDWGLAQPPPR